MFHDEVSKILLEEQIETLKGKVERQELTEESDYYKALMGERLKIFGEYLTSLEEEDVCIVLYWRRVGCPMG